ncbi:DNA modification methylase [Sphingomonas profundi]|uniref:DNA modification methylase n=1 Tax=Alterirhizorhabdus profundi TaxID=2681549 RepID=UPI0012E8630D|nr:DNA modification methylase [Sphingomonas profundi]
MRARLLSTTSDKVVSRANFAGIRLHIEYLPTRSIVPASRRLRQHGKAQIAKLAAGIERHGFNVPLLVDEACTIVAGQARLDAALLLGLDQVPAIRIAHLTDEQLRLFAIFENKIGEESEWNDAALNLEFEELRLTEPELDLTDSGFAIGEIDALAGRMRTQELNDLDDTGEPDPARIAVTRIGDVWLCGRHRIICGDAIDAAVIAELVDGRAVQQLLTDPPYNVPVRSISTTGRHASFAMAAGEMKPAAFTDFLTGFIGAAQPVLADGALVYVFMDHAHLGELLAAGQMAGLTYKQLLVWVKAAAGLGSFYRSGHELVAVFKHGKGKHCNNLMLGRYGRNRSNVLSYPGVMSMPGGRKALKMHPTVKNVAMIADLILDVTAPGDAVLDCFGGSGTTLIAAEKTERDAFLCELSPMFVDVTIERFEAVGGARAVLAATGQTYAEVCADRLSTEPLTIPDAADGEE